MRELRVLRPGRLEYEEACALQEALVAQRRAGRILDSLILLEHEPVITVGRSFQGRAMEARACDIKIVETSRGGQVTYHGPGQLVGYPILNLRELRCDLHWYLRKLEEVIIRALEVFGLRGRSILGHTGVWIGGKKIASIGIAVRGWVTYHGFALNVDCDMNGFSAIAPCGLRVEDMTRLRDWGLTVRVEEVMPVVASVVQEVFEYRLIAEQEPNAQQPILPSLDDAHTFHPALTK